MGQVALLPPAALLVHQLRFMLAFGSSAGAELQRTGHSYLNWVVPWQYAYSFFGHAEEPMAADARRLSGASLDGRGEFAGVLERVGPPEWSEAWRLRLGLTVEEWEAAVSRIDPGGGAVTGASPRLRCAPPK